MSDSRIVDIYQGASEKKEDTFKSNLESKLHVQTDYEKVIKDTEWIDIMEQTVPYIDKIVLITGHVPCQQTAVSKISELISKEAAVSQVAQTLGIRTQDDIQIDAVSLVYAMQYAGTDQLCAIPSWKVDYVLKNADENTKIRDSGSLWIDAVSGFVADYWKQD